MCANKQVRRFGPSELLHVFLKIVTGNYSKSHRKPKLFDRISELFGYSETAI